VRRRHTLSAPARVDAPRLLSQRDALQPLATHDGPLAQTASIRLRIVRFILRRYRPTLADLGPAEPVKPISPRGTHQHDPHTSAVRTLDLELPTTHAPPSDAASLVDMPPKLERLRSLVQTLSPVNAGRDKRIDIERQQLWTPQWLRPNPLPWNTEQSFAAWCVTNGIHGIEPLKAGRFPTRRGQFAWCLALAGGLVAMMAIGAWLAVRLSPSDRVIWLGFAIMGILPCTLWLLILESIRPTVGARGISWGIGELPWLDVSRVRLVEQTGQLTLFVEPRSCRADPRQPVLEYVIDRFERNPNWAYRWASRLTEFMEMFDVKVIRERPGENPPPLS
jgi:hypothetical protein